MSIPTLGEVEEEKEGEAKKIEDRRKYKEEKREQERKTTEEEWQKLKGRGQWSHHIVGEDTAISPAQQENRACAHQKGTTWPFRLWLQSKDISQLKKSWSDAHQRKNLTNLMIQPPEGITGQAFTSVLSGEAVGPEWFLTMEKVFVTSPSIHFLQNEHL